MPDKKEQDVKITDKTGLVDIALGNTEVEASQGGLTGRGGSAKSGQAGKAEATRNASAVIGAKKAAN
ncbi:MAG: hypothetical protein ABSB74_11265 [Tepidisphaeraceae bacterium]